MKTDIKKLVIKVLPYTLIGLFATKLGQAYRLSAGVVFADKLMNIALPRVRDFRGLSPASFDGRGNYAMGVREQLIFPEIEYDKVEKIRGMDIIFVTTARTDEEARALLKCQIGRAHV